jgi:hypothetical protein
MPNVSKISGFRPVKHINGSPYNGQANIYYLATASANCGVGDLVVTAGSASAAGVPTVQLCAAGSTASIGAIVGIVNAKLDPVSGAMTAGSISLDTPQYVASGGSAYVLVADAPDVVYEAEASNGTPTAADIGLNASHANGTFNTTTGTSGAYVDFGTEATTAALTLKILSLVLRPDNEMGASAKLLVKINNHQFQGGTGTAGV